MKRFEYKIAYDCDNGNLSQYGKEGWELVAVAPRNDGHSMNFYFKRELKV